MSRNEPLKLNLQHLPVTWSIGFPSRAHTGSKVIEDPYGCFPINARISDALTCRDTIVKTPITPRVHAPKPKRQDIYFGREHTVSQRLAPVFQRLLLCSGDQVAFQHNSTYALVALGNLLRNVLGHNRLIRVDLLAVSMRAVDDNLFQALHTMQLQSESIEIE
jgi:hypothetical protein